MDHSYEVTCAGKNKRMKDAVPAGAARLAAAVGALLSQAQSSEAGRGVVPYGTEAVCVAAPAVRSVVGDCVLVLAVLLSAAAGFALGYFVRGLSVQNSQREPVEPEAEAEPIRINEPPNEPIIVNSPAPVPTPESTRRSSRTVAAQSVVTYKRKWATPRFHVLSEFEQGVFGEMIG